jgi:hypothetical protein
MDQTIEINWLAKYLGQGKAVSPFSAEELFRRTDFDAKKAGPKLGVGDLYDQGGNYRPFCLRADPELHNWFANGGF